MYYIHAPLRKAAEVRGKVKNNEWFQLLHFPLLLVNFRASISTSSEKHTMSACIMSAGFLLDDSDVMEGSTSDEIGKRFDRRCYVLSFIIFSVS